MSVAPSSFATSLDRRIQMLRTAMGPLIAAALGLINSGDPAGDNPGKGNQETA